MRETMAKTTRKQRDRTLPALQRAGRIFRLNALAGLLIGLPCGPLMAQPSFSPESFITPEFLGAHTLLDVRAQYAYAKGYTGKGVLIAVVDDGLDIDHPEFFGRISPYGGNYLTASDPSYVGRLPGDKTFSHGTHVAGIAAAARDSVAMHGVAFDAQILPLRILGPASQIKGGEAAAFRNAIAQGAGVLNGSYGPPDLPPATIIDPVTGAKVPNPHYQVINFLPIVSNLESDYDTILSAANADIVMVFAAGNEYREQPISSASPSGHAMLPAMTPENTGKGWYRFLVNGGDDDFDINNPVTWELSDVDDPDLLEIDFSDLQGSLIAVVAVDRNGEISSYSNRCGYAQLWCIAAPGGDAPTPGYERQDSLIYSTLPDGTYGLKAGTSMAAPVVSGAAAVLRQAFPYMTARQIIEVLLTSANSTDKNWGDKDIYGWGMLDLGRAIDGPVQFGAEGFPSIFRVDTQGFNSIWSNDISGAGGLIKSGLGHIVMTGANTYQGQTRIQQGKLTVNGSLRNSDLSIEREGALGGSGTVGNVVAAGAVQPGNSIGTLTVAGDYTQLAGSRLEIEMAPDGRADLLQVQGSADIQGGTLQISGLTPDLLGRDIAFLNAARFTANSRFDNADELSLPYVAMTVRQDNANAAQPGLRLSIRRNDQPFAALAATGNQAAVAQAIDQQTVADQEYRAAVMLPDAQGARQLYSQLSGEIHASALSALIDTSGLLRQASLGRMAHADVGFSNEQTGGSEPHGAWARVLGSWGTLGASDEAARMTRSLGGFMFGADTRLGANTRAGLAGALTSSSYGTDAMGSAKADGYHLMAYAGATQGPWALRGGASYSWYDIDTRRHIAYPGMGEQKADYRAGSAQIFAEAAYTQQWDNAALEQYLNMAQVWTRRGSFSEDGSIGALQGDSQNVSTAFATLGLRGRYDFHQAKGGQLSATAGLGWRHLIGKTAPASDMRFTTGPSFSISGAPMARNALLTEVGLEWASSRNSRLSLVYSGQLAGGTRDHGIQARASWVF